MDSIIKEKKEHNERVCFLAAVELSKSKDHDTKELLQYFNGTPVNRANNDRPDLIYICTTSDYPKNEIIVGIEHFRVDQVSKQKNTKSTKRISLGAEYKSHIDSVYNIGHSEYEEKGDSSDEIKDALINQIAGLVQENTSRGYNTFIDDFSCNLDKHLEQVEAYRKNVADYANGRKVEIAFLIEAHAYFQPLFLNNDGRVVQNPVGRIVIFKEIAKLLSSIDSKTVNYIVLLFDGSGFERNTDVIALRTGNIHEQLRDKGISVYEYAGSDLDGRNGFCQSKLRWEKDGNGNFDIITDYSDVNESEALHSVMKAARIAWNAQKRGVPFATTRDVQSFLDAATPYLIGFINNDQGVWPQFRENTDFRRMWMDFTLANYKYKGMEQWKAD